MTDQTASQLEHEAELARARMADTAESLRVKMTPGQMFDEVTSYFGGSDGGKAFGNLSSQIRDNPLPVALVGIGLAWLFIGGGPSAAPKQAARRPAPDTDWNFEDPFDDGISFENAGDGSTHRSEEHGSHGGIGSAASSAASAVGGAMSSAASMVSSAAGAAGSSLRSAAGAAAGAVGATASGIGSAASGVGRTASHLGGAATSAGSQLSDGISGGSKRAGDYARKGVSTLLDQEPLVLAAIGIAVGAAIGAAFPSTAIEDETVGRYRDQVGKKVKDAASAVVGQAAELADEAIGTLKDNVETSGIADQGSDIVQAVGNIVRDTAESVDDAVRNRLGEFGDKLQPDHDSAAEQSADSRAEDRFSDRT